MERRLGTDLKSQPKVLHFRLFFPTEAGFRPHNFFRMLRPVNLSTQLSNKVIKFSTIGKK